MAILIDTDIAIHVRDGSQEIVARLVERAELPHLSLATFIELQSGLAGDDALVAKRRAGLGKLLELSPIVPLDVQVAERYGKIVQASGYSRTRVFDRLIAATALVHDLTLVTINGEDFRDIPGLKLEVWPTPPQ